MAAREKPFEALLPAISPVRLHASTSAAVSPTTAPEASRRRPSTRGASSKATETTSVPTTSHSTPEIANDSRRFVICTIESPNASSYGTLSSAYGVASTT